MEMSNDKLQLARCDVMLMIPGYLEKEKITQDGSSAACEIYVKAIDSVIKEEYKDDFIDEIERRIVGDYTIRVKDFITKKPFTTTGSISYIIHKDTGFCILEIYVLDCTIGGNKLLGGYRSGDIEYFVDNSFVSESELLEICGIVPYGDKRSMVFAYEDPKEDEILNALANEEYPMGKLGGKFGTKLQNDLALYDVASVYVSEVTMIEVIPKYDSERRKRIESQSIEIFFVELLLLQDASIEKINYDLRVGQDNLIKGIGKGSSELLDKLSFDIGKTADLADFSRFSFPTTRESARRVSEAFGIEQLYGKYEKNRNILATMTETYKRRKEKEEAKIKNRFLFILTALSAFSAVNGAVDKLNIEKLKPYSYFYIHRFGGCSIFYLPHHQEEQEKCRGKTNCFKKRPV